MVDDFKHNIKISFKMFKIFLSGRIRFKTSFIFLVISSFLQNIIPIFFINIIYNAKFKILNYDYYEILFIYGTSRLIFGIFYFFFSNIFSIGYKYVIFGEIEKHIIRPFSTFLSICFENINIVKISDIMLSIFIIIYTNSRYKLLTNFIDLIAYFIILTSSIIIITSFYTLLATTSFYIKNPNYINIFKRLEIIANYPIGIYNSVIKFILTFIIPFLFAGPIPHLILKSTNKFVFLIKINILSLLFFKISSIYWKKSIKKYNGSG